MSAEQKSPSQVERNQLDIEELYNSATSIVIIGRWVHNMLKTNPSKSRAHLQVKRPILFYTCRICGVDADMRVHTCPPIIKNKGG